MIQEKVYIFEEQRKATNEVRSTLKLGQKILSNPGIPRVRSMGPSLSNYTLLIKQVILAILAILAKLIFLFEES